MKTKLEMAHEYAIALINSDCEMQFDKFIQLCWNYADAMQDEADKRENEEQSEHVFEAIDEWQPDWSQAPRCDVVAWDINKHGQGRWIASDNGYYLAPSFGYTGDWRNSLRKRPQ